MRKFIGCYANYQNSPDLNRMPPDRGLFEKATSGVKGNKTRLTYAFTINADGSEKLCPVIIGKAEKPRAFRKKSGGELGFYYRSNVKAWMTTALYQEWILDWDRKLQRQQRHVLLLQDNFSGHVPPEGLTNIRVENFSPNLTTHVQPADAGIIRCFKAHYRSAFIDRALDRYEGNVSVTSIYDIDQLEAMRLAEVAWNDISSETIRNCWHKTGILPEHLSATLSAPSIPISSLLNSTDVDPITCAEKEVLDSLAQLGSTGILKQANMMDLGQLLDLQKENELIEDISDVEIFEAVMSGQETRSNKKHEGKEDDDNDEVVVVEKPNRAAALEASFVLQGFVSDLDDPFACEMRAVLAKFGRRMRSEQARSLQATRITDYFTQTSTNSDL
jgi:hypothetical protein